MYRKRWCSNTGVLAGIFFLLIFLCVPVQVKAAWVKNSNGTYSFYTDDGKKATNRWIGEDYYVNSSGLRQTGWLYKGQKWYYFNKEGKLLRNIWIRSKGNTYYAGANGVIYTSGRYKIRNYYYAFDKRGIRLTGRRTINGKTYYFMKSNGRMLKKCWVKTGSYIYYFNSSGEMVTNQWVGLYYVGKTGARVTNTWKDEKYLGSDGRAVSGLQEINGVYYYFSKKTYKKVTSASVVVSGTTYKFDSKGKGTIVKPAKAPSTNVSVESTYYTDKYVDDETLLASIIYCEAGNQAYTGKVAVGMVIMNRVYASGFPSKMREVIYAKSQFTPARDGSLTKAIQYPARVTAECKKAAKEVIAKYDGYKKGQKVYLTINGKKTEFPYLFFMTSAAYNRLGLRSAYKQIGAHVFFKVWA